MMKKLSEKGIAHIILLLILIAGLGIGLYLVQHPQIFRPRANVNAPSAQFVDASGNQISQTTTASVKLKIVKNSGGSTTAADNPLPTLIPSSNSSPQFVTAVDQLRQQGLQVQTIMQKSTGQAVVTMSDGKTFDVAYDPNQSATQLVTGLKKVIEFQTNPQLQEDLARKSAEVAAMARDDPETVSFLNELPKLIESGEVELGHLAYLDTLTTRTLDSANKKNQLMTDGLKRLYPCRDPLSDPDIIRIRNQIASYRDKNDGSYNTANHPKLCP